MSSDQRFFRSKTGEVYITNDDIKGHYYSCGDAGVFAYHDDPKDLVEVFITDKTPAIPIPEEPRNPGTVARAAFANHQDPESRLIFLMALGFTERWSTMNEVSGDTDDNILFGDFMSDDGEWYLISFDVLHTGL